MSKCVNVVAWDEDGTGLEYHLHAYGVSEVELLKSVIKEFRKYRDAVREQHPHETLMMSLSDFTLWLLGAANEERRLKELAWDSRN